MEFNFDSFFGYEYILTESPEIIIFIALICPIILIALLSIIGYCFRKMKLNMYLIQVSMFTLILTTFFGTFSMLILFFVSDQNGIKMAYCLITIFLGMFIFCILNTGSILKLIKDWSEVIEKK